MNWRLKASTATGLTASNDSEKERAKHTTNAAFYCIRAREPNLEIIQRILNALKLLVSKKIDDTDTHTFITIINPLLVKL